MENYWFLAPMLRFVISSASLNSSRCTGQTTRSIDEEIYFMLEGSRVTRLDVHVDWAEFDHFWNWFG